MPTVDADLVLFEAGPFERAVAIAGHSGAMELVSFVRQFSFEDDQGEYLGMEQLRLSLMADEPGPSSAPTSAIVWAAPRPSETGRPVVEGIHPDLHAWKSAVEAEPAFQFAGTWPLRRGELHYGGV